KLGLHLANFTYGVDGPGFAPKLDEILRNAEDAGIDRISVMDHYFQIPFVGPAENEMFEAYGILGYIAARTTRVELGTLVTGVTYRNPGFLVKQVTGLDVLSGGRAWFGVGAAWFEREHIGLGFAFPPLKQRFEMLEETIQVAHQMWSDDDGPFVGKHYQLAETICSPRPIQQPRPKIMIGGSGEKKTLRLVAKYADRCNVAGDNPENARRRFEILRGHCDAVGRDYDSIDRTIVGRYDPKADGSGVDQLVHYLGAMAEAGVQGIQAGLIGCEDPKVWQVMKERVIPQVRAL
ncbi:MAG: LLM class F420-dependent oxidoreductase, partial [Dehalococcoidia bacterium]